MANLRNSVWHDPIRVKRFFVNKTLTRSRLNIRKRQPMQHSEAQIRRANAPPLALPLCNNGTASVLGRKIGGEDLLRRGVRHLLMGKAFQVRKLIGIPPDLYIACAVEHTQARI